MHEPQKQKQLIIIYLVPRQLTVIVLACLVRSLGRKNYEERSYKRESCGDRTSEQGLDK